MLQKTLFIFTSLCLIFSSELRSQDTPCECSRKYWVDAEYLYWKVKDGPKSVPLVVEGPAVPEGSRVLNQPGYKIILGHKKTESDWQSGGRLTLGCLFACEDRLGVEANYFLLQKTESKHSVHSSGSLGSSFFAIPYFDVVESQESSVAIARPGSFAGSASLKICNKMQGAEINAFMCMQNPYNLNIDLLCGFKYWYFTERLAFDTDSPNVPPTPVDIFRTQDKFDMKNNFYGGQFGLKLNYACNKLFLNLNGKIAFGAMCQTADIYGHLFSNSFNGLGDVQTYSGGYFALLSNRGHHKRKRFAVIPEVDLNIGYQITGCFQIKLGYTFLYASNVLRPGRQVNRYINPSQSSAIEFAPNPTPIGLKRPKPDLKAESIWVQGFNIGFEFIF